MRRTTPLPALVGILSLGIGAVAASRERLEGRLAFVSRGRIGPNIATALQMGRAVEQVEDLLRQHRGFIMRLAILIGALAVVLSAGGQAGADDWKDESGKGRGFFPGGGWGGPPPWAGRGGGPPPWAGHGETPGWARGKGYWDGHFKHGPGGGFGGVPGGFGYPGQGFGAYPGQGFGAYPGQGFGAYPGLGGYPGYGGHPGYGYRWPR
ncbi:hypothetical protein [Tautonia plasticadhaerens]|uniref:Uncharacterized protein n=1 Tax=Tautonia plasticadhaerens TaxID=2527974 RepID=A0A518H469_9BACT|nr:hypothetical protein [Tautonia plasticadhaerens]QDV35608.1 hypothetical protein ElP_35120 [Tautonia plasticadhaerens]